VYKEDRTQKHRKNIPYAILPATLFSVNYNKIHVHNHDKFDLYKIAQKNKNIKT